jgi:DNA-binding transcriptional MocR family regulator
MSAVLKHLAAIAKDLSKAELHVLIELASRAEAAGGLDANASSRDLAEATGLARSSAQLAIDSLNKKGLIHSDAGAGTRAAYHRLIFLNRVRCAVVMIPRLSPRGPGAWVKTAETLLISVWPCQLTGPSSRRIMLRLPSDIGGGWFSSHALHAGHGMPAAPQSQPS